MDINTIKITPEILNLIAEIDEFKGAWKALGTLAPERLAALRKVATIESIGSSTRIEGVKLSDRQIETLLSNIDNKSFTTRDERVQRSLASCADLSSASGDAGSAQEVAGYASVMQILFDSWEMIPITAKGFSRMDYIKQLHSILLQYSHKDTGHRGKYKSIDNHIEAFDSNGRSLGVLFTTASPMMTTVLMRDLVDWARTAFTEKQLHPLLVIEIFIVRFLKQSLQRGEPAQRAASLSSHSSISRWE